MVEGGFAVHFIVGRELFGIYPVGDVDGRRGAVLAEEGGVFPGDGGNAVDLADGVQLIVFQCLGQMLDEGALQEETGALGDAFPDEMFHVVGSKHDGSLGVFAEGLHIGGHEKRLELDHVVDVGLQHFDEAVGKLLRDETLHMVRLLGKQVLESLEGAHPQIHVDELDAGILPVFLWDVVGGDVVFGAVDR